MPRVSREQNRIDVDKVIRLLIKDSSAEIDSIVQQTGLSSQQVYKILRHLEEKKIIFGNPRLIDLAKINKKRFVIFAKRSGLVADGNTINSALHGEEYSSRMAKENIDVIHEDDFTCSGEYDMITIIVVENTLQATKYVDFLRSISHNYFSKISIVEVLFTTRKNTIWAPDIEDFTKYVSEVSAYGKKR